MRIVGAILLGALAAGCQFNVDGLGPPGGQPSTQMMPAPLPSPPVADMSAPDDLLPAPPKPKPKPKPDMAMPDEQPGPGDPQSDQCSATRPCPGFADICVDVGGYNACVHL